MKKHILFVVPYPVGESPSQRFRFEQYFQALANRGYRYDVRSFWSLKTWKILYQDDFLLAKVIALLKGFFQRLFQLLFIVPRADFVFVHREATPLGVPWFEWATTNIFKKKLIYDFDDAIWLPNTSKENRLATWLKWHSKVKSICGWSYKVSAGNEYLCEFANHYNPNVVLNPTTIDIENHQVAEPHTEKEQGGVITIGWTGSHSTLKYLKPLESIISSLNEKFPGKIKLLIIANKKPDLKISYQFQYWSKETEIKDLRPIDIGVMPLNDDIWSKGKCGFKALQFMSLSIPTAASPVGANKKIFHDGINGFLCATSQDWIDRLSELVESKEMRTALGEQGRQTVLCNYSVRSNSSNFLSLFS